MMNLAVKRWHVQGLLCSCSLWYWNLARGLTLLSGSETKHTPSFPLDLNFAVTICYSFVLWPESISHASYARVVAMKTTLLHTQEKCACHNHLIKGSKEGWCLSTSTRKLVSNVYTNQSKLLSQHVTSMIDLHQESWHKKQLWSVSWTFWWSYTWWIYEGFDDFHTHLIHLLCQSVRQSNLIISTPGASSLPICQTNEFDHLHLMHLLQQSVRSRNSIISTWDIFFTAPSDQEIQSSLPSASSSSQIASDQAIQSSPRGASSSQTCQIKKLDHFQPGAIVFTDLSDKAKVGLL